MSRVVSVVNKNLFGRHHCSQVPRWGGGRWIGTYLGHHSHRQPRTTKFMPWRENTLLKEYQRAESPGTVRPLGDGNPEEQYVFTQHPFMCAGDVRVFAEDMCSLHPCILHPARCESEVSKSYGVPADP